MRCTLGVLHFPSLMIIPPSLRGRTCLPICQVLSHLPHHPVAPASQRHRPRRQAQTIPLLPRHPTILPHSSPILEGRYIPSRRSCLRRDPFRSHLIGRGSAQEGRSVHWTQSHLPLVSQSVSQSVDTNHLPLSFVSNGAGTVHTLQPSLADRTYPSLPRRSCESRGRVDISSSLDHTFCMYELCALSFGRMGRATVSEGGCDSAWREVRVLVECGVVVGWWQSFGTTGQRMRMLG